MKDIYKEKDIYFGSNIRVLRNLKGETQSELKSNIDNNGKSKTGSISNYENNTRTPDMYILKDFSNHFRIPIDELLCVDYSYYDEIKIKKFVNVFSLCPLVSSENALKNKNFKKGYEIYEQFSKIENPELFEEKSTELTELYEYFTNASDEDIFEARVNLYILIIILMIHIKFIKSINPKNIKYFTKNMDNSIKKFIYSGIDKFNKFSNPDFDFDGNEILDEINEWKRQTDLLDIAEYYFAFLFLFELIPATDFKYSKYFGEYYICYLANKGNIHAKNYLNKANDCIEKV